MSLGIVSKKYYMVTLDPLHIGSGGLSLGKVDNPVTLDPATQLPKVPGTGISGATKYFTDLALIHLEQEDDEFDIGRRQRNQRGQKTVWCASTHGACEDGCLLCYTFGYSTPQGRNSKGVLAFHDAHLVFFPIYSAMYGRVWITCRQALQTHLPAKEITTVLRGAESLTGFQVQTAQGLSKVLGNQVEIGGYVFQRTNSGYDPAKWAPLFAKIGWESAADKLMILSEEHFSRLVRRNLEQRTCVAIDPETGAAKEGALFTFEAVPAGALFVFQVNKNEYKIHQSPFRSRKHSKAIEQIKKLAGHNGAACGPFELIQLGFKGIEEFGMGGMNTRGFGRLRIIEQ